MIGIGVKKDMKMTKDKAEDTFCPLLFQHLATHPYGGVTHCCIADHRKSISSATDDLYTEDGKNKIYYNLNRDSIYDTFNSKSFRRARMQVLNGEKPTACMRCYREEDMGIKSKRYTERYNFPEYTIDVARKAVDQYGYIKDLQFDFVELRLGNVCNVSCRTCNPASSSKWRNDYNELRKKLTFVTPYDTMDSFKWPEQEKFWDELLDYTKNAKVFYINGGEPTLIKQHFKFLQRLADAGRTDVKLWYNINMTNLSQEIIEVWRNFDNVKISCSIDDLDSRNEYIRYPTEWKKLVKNLDWLINEHYAFPGKYELDITQTVSFMNYPYLDEFYRHFRDGKDIWVHHNFVNDPDYLSPAILPEDMKKDIHERFRSTFEEWKVNQLIEQFEGKFKQEQFDKAMQYTKALDKIRGEDFLKVFPEFENYVDLSKY